MRTLGIVACLSLVAGLCGGCGDDECQDRPLCPPPGVTVVEIVANDGPLPVGAFELFVTYVGGFLGGTVDSCELTIVEGSESSSTCGSLSPSSSPESLTLVLPDANAAFGILLVRGDSLVVDTLVTGDAGVVAECECPGVPRARVTIP